MNILVIGSGGREHALAWRIAQSSQVQKVFVAPGNGGTGSESAKRMGIENLPITDLNKLAQFAQEKKIHLTVVGPVKGFAHLRANKTSRST
jgi:phosphoribosylamine--glycine ligase